MKKLHTVLLSLTAFAFMFLVAAPQPAHAQLEKSSSILQQAGEAAYGKDAVKNQKTLGEQIGGIIKILLRITGFLLVILLIYGGFIWMLARGNESEVEKAKDIIRNAIIGIVIVFTAFSITVFVMKGLETSTGTTFTELKKYDKK